MICKMLDIHLLEFSDEVILRMSESEILDWLINTPIEEVKVYYQRYIKLEYYEICAIIRDYFIMINIK